MESKTDVDPAPLDPLVGRRLRFLPAFKAEIKQWRRLSNEDESLIRMFCACVAMRMRGEDPATLLERHDETIVANCDSVAVG